MIFRLRKEDISYWIIMIIWIFLSGSILYSFVGGMKGLLLENDMFLPIFIIGFRILFFFLGFIGLVKNFKNKKIFNSFLIAFALYYVIDSVLMMPFDIARTAKLNELLNEGLGMRYYLLKSIDFVLAVVLAVVFYIKRREKFISELKPSKKLRFVNFILDKIFIFYYTFYALATIFSFSPSQPFGFFTSLFLVIFISYAFASTFYYLISEWIFNTTFGKIITKTIVTGKYGLPTFSEVLIRSLARLIPFDSFSILGNNKINTWHDSLSKTSVNLTERSD